MALVDDPAVLAAIEATLAEAPRLTPEQGERLASLLNPSTREPNDACDAPVAA